METKAGRFSRRVFFFFFGGGNRFFFFLGGVGDFLKRNLFLVGVLIVVYAFLLG